MTTTICLQNTLGLSLRAARKALKVRQAEVAERAGLPRQSVIRAEAGEGSWSSYEAIVSALDLTLDSKKLPEGEHLGQRFQGLRKDRRLTQAEVAAMAGITRSTIAAIEANAPGHLSAVQRLSDALGAGLQVFQKRGGKTFWTTTAASSRDQTWTTPQSLLQALYRVVGDEFDLDPCSPRKDGPVAAKVRYTAKDDGLSRPWPPGVVFCNPPYGRAIGQWVAKCREEAERRPGAVIGLFPSRTGTQWFQAHVSRHADIIMVRGRLVFGADEDGDPAPFDSTLAIWNGSPELIEGLREEFKEFWFIAKTF